MGPTAGVLLPTQPTPAMLAWLDELLASIATPIPDMDRCFWVTTTRPIGGNYVAQGKDGHRPFSLEVCLVAIDDTDEDDEENPDEPSEPISIPGVSEFREYFTTPEIDAVRSAFGFRPLTWIGVGANCSSHDDHRILAELCAHLAERLGGAVDLGGRLYGHVPPDVVKQFHPAGPDYLREQQQFVARATATLPGTLTQTNDRQFCDATFLRAWLAHPYFRMIK